MHHVLQEDICKDSGFVYTKDQLYIYMYIFKT